jgi:hypothetical protein
METVIMPAAFEDSTVDGDMRPGRCGTGAVPAAVRGRPGVDRHPVGTALSAPPKPAQQIVSLLPDDVKWKMFFAGQAKNTKYLHDGDVVEATIGTADGKIDLGTQRNVVRYS